MRFKKQGQIELEDGSFTDAFLDTQSEDNDVLTREELERLIHSHEVAPIRNKSGVIFNTKGKRDLLISDIQESLNA